MNCIGNCLCCLVSKMKRLPYNRNNMSEILEPIRNIHDERLGQAAQQYIISFWCKDRWVEEPSREINMVTKLLVALGNCHDPNTTHNSDNTPTHPDTLRHRNPDL